jgi:SAM-dependent methyltransferase
MGESETGAAAHRSVSYAPAFGMPLATTVFGHRVADREGAFFLPHLRPGMALLDCGCGPGSITMGLAERVAPGRVVGIDRAAAALDLARVEVAERGPANVAFAEGDVHDLPFADATFDAAFVHALLEHVRDPVAALTEIRRVVKPGGVVGVRSPDLGGTLLAPPSPLLEQFGELTIRLREQAGGHPYVGRTLRGLMRQAGFERVVGSASMECAASPETTAAYADTRSQLALGPLTDPGIALDWVDRPTLEQMSVAWRDWGAHPDAFVALPWGEAVGWKD